MARHDVMVEITDYRWDDGTRKMFLRPDGLQHLPPEDKAVLVQLFARAIELPGTS